MKVKINLDNLSDTAENILSLVACSEFKHSYLADVLNLKVCTVNEKLAMLKKKFKVDSLASLQEHLCYSDKSEKFFKNYKQIILEHKFDMFAMRIKQIIKTNKPTMLIKTGKSVSKYTIEYQFIINKLNSLGFCVKLEAEADKVYDLVIIIDSAFDVYQIATDAQKNNLHIKVKLANSCECNCSLYFMSDNKEAFYHWLLRVSKHNFLTKKDKESLKGYKLGVKEIDDRIRSVRSKFRSMTHYAVAALSAFAVTTSLFIFISNQFQI